MDDVVNLRRARKGRERQCKEAEAAENRIAFRMTSGCASTASARRPNAASMATGSSAPMTREESARVVKRSLIVAGHRTSVSLEDAFWRRLKAIAAERGLSVNALAAGVDAARGEANLSSALRVFVLEALAPPRASRPARQGAQ